MTAIKLSVIFDAGAATAFATGVEGADGAAGALAGAFYIRR